MYVAKMLRDIDNCRISLIELTYIIFSMSLEVCLSDKRVYVYECHLSVLKQHTFILYMSHK